MKRLVQRGIMLAFITPVVALAGSNGERVTYPGLNCKFYAPQGDDTHFDPSGYSANGLKNTSGGSKYVACPIVKPEFNSERSSDQDGYTKDARVTMTSGDFDCKLYKRSLTSASSGWYATDVIILQSNGLYRHTIEPTSGSNRLATNGYSVSLYCSLPGGGYINNYDHRVYWQN